MIYIDPSVLPSLADTFRSCGELISGIKKDLQKYLLDVSDKFHEQKTTLENRAEEAARQLKEAEELQEEAARTRVLAISYYETSVHNLDVLKDHLDRAWDEGEWYEDECNDLEQQIQDQQDTIEANELYMNNAIADFEQAEIELQNAQSIYDDAQYRLEESRRIVEDFDKLNSQFRAALKAPNKDIRIDLDSEVYKFTVSQDYSIKTMLGHLSKDYINKALAALDDVQQKVDAILNIGRQHFGCDIAPVRAVVSTSSSIVGTPRKNIVALQATNETFCPKCRQLKAICRCNEIVDKTTRSYIKAKEKIQELEQEAKELKAKIDQLQPFEDASNSLYRNTDEEIEQIRIEQKNLLNEYYTGKLNIENYERDRKQALLQAEKDDEKVYHSPEWNALRDKVDGLHRENRLLEDRAGQLDKLIEKRRDAAFWAASEKREAQALEEQRLGGTLEDFEKKYKIVISLLVYWRKRLVPDIRQSKSSRL